MEPTIMPIPPHPRHWVRPTSISIGIVAIIAITIVLIKVAVRHPATTNTTNTTTRVTAATPKYFTDIVGTVSSVTGSTVVVAMKSQTADGVISTHDYQVTIGPKTVLSSIHRQTGQPTGQTTVATDIAAGTSLQAFGDGQTNLGTTFSFTATRLVRLVD